MVDIISYLLTVLMLKNTLGQDVLRTVAVLYRHGDRTPTKTYPKDPYSNTSKYWPEGFGQLTNLGIQHQFELGQWFRTRYNQFLPDKYTPSDIYVRSTDVDRTLASAAANLAGLYPPKKSQVWNKNLLWRPIPIHTVQNEEDAVLAMKKKCARYDFLYAQLEYSVFFKLINEKYRELYQYLSDNTGWNVSGVRQVETLYSVLSIENQRNLTLPLWTNQIFPCKLQPIAALCHASFSFTKPLARLRNGPFFDYLFTYFNSVINNTSTTKFLMLSAHDNTIVNVLSAMRLYDYRTCPKFTSSIIWELWQNAKDFYVKLYYKNGEGLVQLKLPGCGVDCKYAEFRNLLAPVTVNITRWVEECSEV